MRYIGYIHRLFLMLSEKGFTAEEIIDKIYDIMNKDKEIIGGITKIEIKQALIVRDLI
jgi:hypothetical protein